MRKFFSFCHFVPVTAMPFYDFPMLLVCGVDHRIVPPLLIKVEKSGE